MFEVFASLATKLAVSVLIPYIMAHPAILVYALIFALILWVLEQWLPTTNFVKANSTGKLIVDVMKAFTTAFFAAPWKEKLAAIMGDKAPAGGLPAPPLKAPDMSGGA
jgi:hypothetical protein